MSFEVEVQPTAFTKRIFYIDETKIQYHDTEMEISEVIGFSYYSSVTKVNLAAVSTEYHIYLMDDSGDEIEFTFLSAWGATANAKEKFDNIVASLWHYLGNDLLNTIHRNLLEGVSSEFKSCDLTPEGLKFTTSPMFGKGTDYIIPWEDLHYETYQDIITFKSIKDKRAKLGIRFGELNTALLMFYSDWLKKDKQRIWTIYEKNKLKNQ